MRNAETPPTLLTVALIGLFIWVPVAIVFAIVNPHEEPAGQVAEIGLIIVLSLARSRPSWRSRFTR